MLTKFNKCTVSKFQQIFDNVNKCLEMLTNFASKLLLLFFFCHNLCSQLMLINFEHKGSHLGSKLLVHNFCLQLGFKTSVIYNFCCWLKVMPTTFG